MIGWLLAAQIAVVANAPDTAVACIPFEITAAARAPGTVAPGLSLAASDGLQVLRRTILSRAETDALGASFAVTEGRFLVAARATGRVALPAVAATLGRSSARSRPWSVLVRANGAGEDEPLVLVQASLDDRTVPDGRVDTVLVGQQVDYLVSVRLNAAARRRMRRNPTFFPPDMPAVLAYDVEPPAPVRRSGPQCFESLSYRRALFPLFPGRTAIPPAALTYAIPVSASFFSREETHELRTDSVVFVALEPPAAGRPADYLGAVGTLRATSRLGSATARMGDPLVLTMRVEGSGNVKLLPRPALSLDWAAIARGAERVEVDSALGRVRGAKEFDWLLTPRRAGRGAIPPIRYPYYDPARAGYELALTDSLAIDIAPASLAAADTAVSERPSIRGSLGPERGPALPDRPAFWLLLALAPLPASLRRARRIRLRAAGGTSAALRLQHAAAAATPFGARDIRRLYLDALRERVPSLAPATARNPLGRQLRRAGVTEQTADAAESLLDQLDAAAFGGTESGRTPLLAEALRVAHDVDREAVRIRPRGEATTRVLLVVALITGGVLHAQPQQATARFSDGARAWAAGEIATARRQFALAATIAPRNASAWANYGTAALAAGDTAHAVAAWQRALRLEPLDRETRTRLDAIRPGMSITARGYVPPVSVDMLATSTVILWVGAWLALAIAPGRRPPVVRSLAGGSIALAVVLLAGTLELRDRLDPRGLGVLRRSVSLADSPAPGRGASAPGAIGEVGLLGAREGGWVRITLDGARAGWVPAGDVLPLDDATSN